ncbi:hypothetical protein GPECTOR_6g611 [Gonium pectorale]|uniref:Uncharacterized protein n=1 Tax=Gonium pectorale TaxID=33097 RepID=A0A150GV74_GONPE|nr:hypothetical protein GPECTOR_6g611 [Gonium pectorale]|eukprot:KXZ53694.1 hypothetical protein GPECTOR_6g611 [Gonium pectorale]
MLADTYLDAMGSHWAGDSQSLNATLGLLRAGRETLLPLVQPRQRRSAWLARWRELAAKPPQPSAISDWLAAAEATVQGIAEAASYPALRRCVVALILQAWSAAGARWSQSDDAAAMRILLKLYSLHRSAALRKSAVEYYHFSKSAGTSVCVASAVEGCTTYSTSEQFTCLMPAFVDGPRWISRQAHEERCRIAMPDYGNCTKSIYSKLAKWGSRYPKGSLMVCRKRAKALELGGLNFYASEYTLRGQGGVPGAPPALCGQFLNFAVVSHLQFLVRLTHNWMGRRTAQYYDGMSLADWHALLPGLLDNFYTRGLLGERVFYLPVGGLNASQLLPAAQAALGAMDVLLVLEVEARSATDTHAEVEEIANQVLPSGAAAQELEQANSLDEQVYSFAVLMSRLDAVVWAAAEAAGEEPLKMPKSLPPQDGD